MPLAGKLLPSGAALWLPWLLGSSSAAGAGSVQTSKSSRSAAMLHVTLAPAAEQPSGIWSTGTSTRTLPPSSSQRYCCRERGAAAVAASAAATSLSLVASRRGGWGPASAPSSRATLAGCSSWACTRSMAPWVMWLPTKLEVGPVFTRSYPSSACAQGEDMGRCGQQRRQQREASS